MRGMAFLKILVVSLGVGMGSGGRLSVNNTSTMSVTRRFKAPACMVSRGEVESGCGEFCSTFSGCCSSFGMFCTYGTGAGLTMVGVLRDRNYYVSTISPKRIRVSGVVKFSKSEVLFANGGVAGSRLGCIRRRNTALGVSSMSTLGELSGVVSPRKMGVSFEMGPVINTKRRSRYVANKMVDGFNVVRSRTIRMCRGTERLKFGPMNVRSRVNSNVLSPRPFGLTVRSAVSVTKGIRRRTKVSFRFISFNKNMNVPCAPRRGVISLSGFTRMGMKLFGRGLRRCSVNGPAVCLRPKECLIKSTDMLLMAIGDVGRDCEGFVNISKNFRALLEPTVCSSCRRVISTDEVSTRDARAISVTKGMYRSNSLFTHSELVPRIRRKSMLNVLGTKTCNFAVSSGCGSEPLASRVLMASKGYSIMHRERAFRSLCTGRDVPTRLG